MIPLSTQRASSSVPPSSSTSPRPRWIHDVFLNFHGEDTRKSFTDHLYIALEKKGIITFKDDEKLERGKYISQELLKAIRESMYAIPIISKNYASSRWCLIELAQIVECMRETGLTILPVFYHVDPSEVRNQTGAFAEAFARHEEDPNIDMEKIQMWRVALKEVGNISGWHFHLRLRMHDLLQKMGQEIIYDESPEEPGRRSRLWHYKDVLHVLKNNTGTDVIEGMVLNLPNQNEDY
ncbi:TMV resistance protein N-like [Juglans regia]|uniref:TMV resistance protein N-like n=1 Tax=Juglans regia TaxID=51240 RepID=A0A6P9ESD5_JUGRE|nr:TMV resistance protein N-like [Juglans regia]